MEQSTTNQLRGRDLIEILAWLRFMFTASSFEKKWWCKTRHSLSPLFSPGIFERLFIDLHIARYESWYAMWRNHFIKISFSNCHIAWWFCLPYSGSPRCWCPLEEDIFLFKVRMVLKKSLWKKKRKTGLSSRNRNAARHLLKEEDERETVSFINSPWFCASETLYKKNSCFFPFLLFKCVLSTCTVCVR